MLRKTDLKNWGVVYIWNPHHHAHPPSYFSFLHACTPLGCKTCLCSCLCYRYALNIADFQRFITFTFAQSETLRVYVPTPTHGHTHERGQVGTPRKSTQFSTKIALTRRLPSAPSLRLLCAHNAYVGAHDTRMTLSCGCTTPHGRTGSSPAISPAHNACGNRRSYVP